MRCAGNDIFPALALLIFLCCANTAYGYDSGRVSTGFDNACVVSETGSIRCQPTSNFSERVSLNIKIPTFTHAKMVSVGRDAACALDDSGVQCWGSGQVVTDQPLREKTINPKIITVGGSHACLLNQNDSIICWGSNDDGQINVPALSHPVTISAGIKHTCAIDDEGVKCWGSNEYGQISVPALSHPVMISAGAKNTCVIADGGVKCWGENNNDWTNIPKITNPIAVSTGEYATCAIDKNKKITCWGNKKIIKNINTYLSEEGFNLNGSLHISVGDVSACILSVTNQNDQKEEWSTCF